MTFNCYKFKISRNFALLCIFGSLYTKAIARLPLRYLGFLVNINNTSTILYDTVLCEY